MILGGEIMKMKSILLLSILMMAFAMTGCNHGQQTEAMETDYEFEVLELDNAMETEEVEVDCEPELYESESNGETKNNRETENRGNLEDINLTFVDEFYGNALIFLQENTINGAGRPPLVLIETERPIQNFQFLSISLDVLIPYRVLREVFEVGDVDSLFEVNVFTPETPILTTFGGVWTGPHTVSGIQFEDENGLVRQYLVYWAGCCYDYEKRFVKINTEHLLIESTGHGTSHMVMEPLFRIRTSWEDEGSQIGAFEEIRNAINATPYGYSVFDSNGYWLFTNHFP